MKNTPCDRNRLNIAEILLVEKAVETVNKEVNISTGEKASLSKTGKIPIFWSSFALIKEFYQTTALRICEISKSMMQSCNTTAQS